MTMMRVIRNPTILSNGSDCPQTLCSPALAVLLQLSIHESEENPGSHILVMKGAPERILDRYFHPLFIRVDPIPAL